MIFLDNASTTRVFPEVVALAEKFLQEDFYNPSATYLPAMQVKKEVENARNQIARALHADKSEITFCSCATEASNWILSSCQKNKQGNIVVTEGEHACIYETAKNLQSRGVDVRFAKLNSDGTVNLSDLLSKVDANTNLVSVIHVSNETGVINDVKQIAGMVKKINAKTLVHSDGVQAFCKVNTDVKFLGVDLYTISGHKFGAPKGIGAIYIKKGVNLAPYIIGGGQESAKRSGTENVFGIISMSAALNLYKTALAECDVKNYDYLVSQLSQIDQTQIIGSTQNNSRMIVAVSFSGCKAEILQSMLCENGILVGRGSACSSRHAGNRVLSAMGLSQGVIDGTLRISLSPSTTRQEIEEAIQKIKIAVEKLRGKKIG